MLPKFTHFHFFLFELIKERGEDIVKVLEAIKSEMNLNFIFLNTIELEGCKNFFITDDIQTKALLEKVLDLKFNKFVAERSGLIMRKQIAPLLKEELEK